MVTQRRVGTCRGQQSPRCCSWLFPGWDLQPWVACPADTQGKEVPGQWAAEDTHHMSVYTGQQPTAGHTLQQCVSVCVLPGRLLSGWGWGVCAAPRPAGSDAGSATGTRPHWDDPGTGLRSGCSPPTHLDTHRITGRRKIKLQLLFFDIIRSDDCWF